MKRQQGIYQRGKIWWIRYRSAGKTQRESSHSEDQAVALEMYRARVGDISRGIHVTSRTANVTVGELLDMLVTAKKKKKSYKDIKTRVDKHLKVWLGSVRAAELNAQHLMLYKEKRSEEKASVASINRELAILHHAYVLAKRGSVILVDAPFTEKLEEPPPRAGYFKPAEFETFVSHLPEEVQPLIRLARWTGWRIEILKTLQWRHINLAQCMIQPDPGSDTKKTGECHYRLNAEVKAIITDRLLARIPLCPWVFHRDGQPIVSFRKAWLSACRAAKCVGKIPHDLRRTAARHFVLDRKVPVVVVMQMMGIHNERTVYRYVGKAPSADMEEAMATTPPQEAKQA